MFAFQELVAKRSLDAVEQKETSHDEIKSEPEQKSDDNEVEKLAENFNSAIDVNEPATDSDCQVHIPEKKVIVNYFEKKSTTTAKNQNVNNDDERYKQVVEKIRSRINTKTREAKLLPVDECVKLLREHEKKVQVNVFTLKMMLKQSFFIFKVVLFLY